MGHSVRIPHWDDPVEQVLNRSGDWADFHYFACVFLAPRKKSQLIRHNLKHMRQLPFYQCGHLHSPKEWAPGQADGRPFFPSKEEAEYSASLCYTLVAVASHWAADQGFALRRIQRLPPVQVTGDWRAMLELPSLGLPSVEGAPVRVCMADVFRPGHPLPEDVIYIGHSHFSHRQPTTKWRSPFITGRDGSPAHVAFRFLHWLPTSQLSAQLSELAGKRLACDCQPNELSWRCPCGGFLCPKAPPLLVPHLEAG